MVSEMRTFMYIVIFTDCGLSTLELKVLIMFVSNNNAMPNRK